MVSAAMSAVTQLHMPPFHDDCPVDLASPLKIKYTTGLMLLQDYSRMQSIQKRLFVCIYYLVMNAVFNIDWNRFNPICFEQIVVPAGINRNFISAICRIFVKAFENSLLRIAEKAAYNWI
jgi:hypothetical protein